MTFTYDVHGYRVYDNEPRYRTEDYHRYRCAVYSCHCNQYGASHDRWNDERRCGYSRCPTCYVVPTIPYHSEYSQWAGETVFRTVKNPCGDIDCTICHPGWSLTAAQLSELKQREITARREQREAEERRLRQRTRTELAQARAKELLYSFMTDEQRNAYISDGIFNVQGSDGNIYKFRHGYSGNVHVPHLGGSKCAHPYMSGNTFYYDDPDRHSRFSMAAEDAMVAQMLLIMTDAESFLRVAYDA